ncbi:MAG: DNA-processing protein DprA [Proteocatella sp.]
MEKLFHIMNCAGITYREFCNISSVIEDLERIYKNINLIKPFISDVKFNKIEEAFVNVDSEFEYMSRFGLEVVTIYGDNYPDKLKAIFDPPYILYFMGDIELLNSFCISVVGSRKPTSYGIFAAKKFSGELAQNGITVVSGLAIGIDTFSHKAAIESGGKTIGILGTSFDNIYPRSNQSFVKDMISKGNLVLSEYPLLRRTMPYHFVQRNRLISAVGEGLVVIEAGEKSGTLTTVDFALEQGRNVFSVPGNINSRNSFGTNYLIKTGAKLIANIEDILEEYPNHEFLNQTAKEEDFLNLSENEKRVVEILKFKGVQNIEKIAFFTNIKIKDIIGILSVLEIKGVVKELGNGDYSL